MPQTIGPAVQLGVTDKNPIKNEPLKSVAKTDLDLKLVANTDLELKPAAKTDSDSDSELDDIPEPVLKQVAKLQPKTQLRPTSKRNAKNKGRNVNYGIVPPTKKPK